jgi:YbgC/YbaW family acyl-CoA thioester hydrolase
VDHAGIIFYGSYVRFFEIAETELFRAAGIPYGEVFNKYQMWLPRAHLDCDFKYPARLDDSLRVAAYFTRFGTSSLALTFDVVHQGAGCLAAVGHEVLVCTDRVNLKSQPIPPELRTALEPYRMSEPDARAALGVSE